MTLTWNSFSNFVVFGTGIRIILASTYMHTLPSHLSCVATLPKNTSAPNKHFFFWVGGSERSGMMRPTDDRWILVFFEISSTGLMCLVAHAPSWLKMRSPTRWHSLKFMVCCSMDTCPLNRCWVILASSEVFAHSGSHLKILSATFVQCLRIEIFNQNTHVYKHSSDM